MLSMTRVLNTVAVVDGIKAAFSIRWRSEQLVKLRRTSSCGRNYFCPSFERHLRKPTEHLLEINKNVRIMLLSQACRKIIGNLFGLRRTCDGMASARILAGLRLILELSQVVLEFKDFSFAKFWLAICFNHKMHSLWRVLVLPFDSALCSLFLESVQFGWIIGNSKMTQKAEANHNFSWICWIWAHLGQPLPMGLYSTALSLREHPVRISERWRARRSQLSKQFKCN
jgi:hypothetical protein